MALSDLLFAQAQRSAQMALFFKSDLDGPGDDDPPLFDPRRQTHNLFKVQLYSTSVIGLGLFLLFCVMRYKFPLIFSVRSYRNKKIQKLPNSLFGWIGVVMSINNDQLLQVIGLDSYVFLRFFRMGIKILTLLSLLGLFILSPLRYYLTGNFDNDETIFSSLLAIASGDHKGGESETEPTSYLAATTLFTYIFTAIIYWCLFSETNHIIRTRQRFLGSQRSLTDRTIYLQGIPENLRNELTLKSHIEELSVGKVEKINFVHDYTPLTKLLNVRQSIVEKLEVLYSKAYGLNMNFFDATTDHYVRLNVELIDRIPDDQDILYTPMTNTIPNEFFNDNQFHVFPVLTKDNPKRLGKLTFFGPKIDLIDHFTRELIKIDDEIRDCKSRETFKVTSDAFVTMDSVTDAQMAAQAVFSPKVFELTTSLAPAPLDVIWENLCLNKSTVLIKRNVIEVIIIAFSILLIIPIRSITALLNVNSIRKMWKEFGDYLMKNSTASAIVTGLLPTYLFTIINVILPYVISFLSNLQGQKSKGDVELSVIKKNFLYIFFNLFLVFTLFGTLSSYKALLSDTTKIAPLLAKSIKSLSLFYIDLILLQGLTMFPFKLLQVGNLFLLFWNTLVKYGNRTPRLFNEGLFKPSEFDLGMILPQHLMILLLTLIYSPISTKILISGLAYFILGFYTYKYQLVYSFVHSYHSTGKSWPIIFKRTCLGVFVLHVQMFGSLALEQSFVLAGLTLPLFPVTLMALIFFDRNYKPLLYYIALDSIKTRGQSVNTEDELFESGGTTLGFDRLINSSGIAHQKSVLSFNAFLDGEENNDAVLLTSEDNSSSQLNGLNNEEEDEEGQETESPSPEPSGGVKIKSTQTLLPQIEEEEDEENDNSIEPFVGEIGVINVAKSSNNNRNNNSRTTTSYTPKFDNAHAKRHKRRASTIEEQREHGYSYKHPAITNPLEGIMVGFQEDMIEYLESREIIASSASKLSSPVRENPVSEVVGHDEEQGQSILTGYVVSRHQNQQVF